MNDDDEATRSQGRTCRPVVGSMYALNEGRLLTLIDLIDYHDGNG